MKRDFLFEKSPKRSFGWIAIKIHNKIKYLKVSIYEETKHYISNRHFSNNDDSSDIGYRVNVTIA